ncbi:MAG: SWIM zinc finger family protein [Kiritimatiellae bacterium]|nr:SWIM zinc finger family protein [Kiritimatiellia bacterium]
MGKNRNYAVRTPLSVRGGIRAQGSASANRRVWWSRRWTEMMERFHLGARLGRGRSYAVSGQVSELEIAPGLVSALVQGASSAPYRSEIRLRRLDAAVRDRIAGLLKSRPILLARLAADELPSDVEEIFLREKMPLFPSRRDDLRTSCSCPDYANPCKHLAAVWLLLGEAFAKRPSVLLAIRGLDPESLLGKPSPPEPSSPPSVARHYTGMPGFSGSAAPSAVLDRLGPLPFWRGHERFISTMESLYARAASRGRLAWAGEALDLRREDEKVVIKGGELTLRHKKLRPESW